MAHITEPLVVTYAKLREELATAEIELHNAKAQLLDHLPTLPSMQTVFAALSVGQPPPAIPEPDVRMQAAHEREIQEISRRITRISARLIAMEFAQRERLITALNRAGPLGAGLLT
jgi:hypothetical protein